MIKWTRAPAFNKEELLDIYEGLGILQAELANKIDSLWVLPSLQERLDRVTNLHKKIMHEIEKLARSK